jgi:hypothetical protein
MFSRLTPLFMSILPLLAALLLGSANMSKMTRTEYHYLRKRPYSAVNKGAKEGGFPVYLIEGKVMVESDEADEYFEKKEAAKVAQLQDLFA